MNKKATKNIESDKTSKDTPKNASAIPEIKDLRRLVKDLER